MDDAAKAGDPSRNGLPVIDRMCAMLGMLELRLQGATIRDLSDDLDLPRSTVYRSLNTLEAHGIVRRSAAGAYSLGPRVLTLAAQVREDVADDDLAAFVEPWLRRLSEIIGEASKVTVRDGDRALVIAVAQGSSGYGLTIIAGQSFPLHAGGASKLLLAHMPEPEIEAFLSQPLKGLTRRTISDPRRLANELKRIRRRGWALDRGEHSTSVHAIAAPIVDGSGGVVAALSVPFLADRDSMARSRIHTAVLDMARTISSHLAARESRDPARRARMRVPA
ncbi:IclR family transcriptional regulator [Marinivivus vitaminiproducens]|uniref:IclR family transcriptional regulator n=1 Tax=Marinivivus vitaminiproducens TaxID=3035935 RepID=UPI00279EEAAF|nr:IclR family transcriptional regulator [Geminicoccaceae bacterium SCSIO 64248]